VRSRIVGGLHPASKGRFTRPSQPPFQHEPLPAVPARLAHGLCASPNHPQPLLAPDPNPLANLMPTSPSTVPAVSRPSLGSPAVTIGRRSEGATNIDICTTTRC
jgi:hypothetical protein